MQTVADFFTSLTAKQKPLADYLFLRIQTWKPELFPSIKYNTIFFTGHKNVCYFSLKERGIDVGFIHGHLIMPRPEFITANRKQVVSLFFAYEEDVNEDLLQSVLDEAIRLDQRFAASGKR